MFAATLPERINHRRLVSDNARLEGSIPLQRFERFIELVEDTGGEVRASLEFRRGHRRRTLLVGKLDTVVTLVCQHCMEPVAVPLTSTMRLFVVNAEAELALLAEDEDGMVCSEEQVRLVDLLEDELILSLPMVGRHPDGECVGYVPETAPEPVVEAEVTAGELYKPFAGLAEITQDLFKK